MNAASPVSMNAPVRQLHPAAHIPVPVLKVASPDADDAIMTAVKAPSLTPGQFLNRTV